MMYVWAVLVDAIAVLHGWLRTAGPHPLAAIGMGDNQP
jgi:1,4-dihydroxy-2-naphthoate octaprenyltransferase